MAKRPGDVIRARMKAFRSDPYQRAVSAALFEAAELVQREAQISITRGSSSGQSGGKHQHVASRPGEAPNNEFGTLANNIEATMEGPRTARVTSNAQHSVPLEFGTSKMAARPFLRPARDRKRKEIEALFAERINRANKLFKGK